MIRDDSKKILQYLLTKAISAGELDNEVKSNYYSLTQELNLQNEKYCCICCQYLNRLGYIIITSDNPQSNDRWYRLTAKGIDFLES